MYSIPLFLYLLHFSQLSQQSRGAADALYSLDFDHNQAGVFSKRKKRHVSYAVVTQGL